MKSKTIEVQAALATWKLSFLVLQQFKATYRIGFQHHHQPPQLQVFGHFFCRPLSHVSLGDHQTCHLYLHLHPVPKVFMLSAASNGNISKHS